MAQNLQLIQLPSPPDDWVEWLSRTKQVSPNTIRLYVHHISQFLGFAELLFPARQPSLYFAWNLKLCQEFLDTIALMVCPSTFQNYYSSLASVRKFLARNKKKPENYSDIEDEFKDMRVGGQRKKTKYIKKQKVLMMEANRNLLREFYCDVYHRDFFWRLFDDMVTRTQKALESGKPVPKFSPGHTFLAIGLMITAGQASNYKRSGNYANIKCAEARQELEKAVTKYEKKFPGREFVQKQRRLDRKFCVPAVLKAENGTKKGDVEYFALLNPRDIVALLLYIDYIRPYGRKPPKTDALFVTSQGESLGSNVTR